MARLLPQGVFRWKQMIGGVFVGRFLCNLYDRFGLTFSLPLVLSTPKLGWVGWIGGKGCGTKFSHPTNSSTIWLQYILGVFPQSCIRWRRRFHSWNQRFYLFKGCNGCQGIHQKQRTCRDMSHVLPWSHGPQFARVASIDFHTLQPSEWMGATGGTVRMEVEVSTMLFMLLLAQELWVHVLWILKISSSSIPGTNNSLTLVYPCRWHCLCTGQVIIRDWKSYKGGIQLWMSKWFFFHGKFEAILWISIMALGRNLRKHVETCGSSVPLVAFIWK